MDQKDSVIFLPEVSLDANPFVWSHLFHSRDTVSLIRKPDLAWYSILSLCRGNIAVARTHFIIFIHYIYFLQLKFAQKPKEFENLECVPCGGGKNSVHTFSRVQWLFFLIKKIRAKKPFSCTVFPVIYSILILKICLLSRMRWKNASSKSFNCI